MDPNIVCGPPVPSFLLTEIHLPLYKFITDSFKDLTDVCMIDAITEEKLTVGSVILQSDILATELQALGCKPGSIVGVICENRLEYPTIMMAVLRTGATLACFNPGYSSGELEHTVSITQPYIMIVDSSSVAKLKQISGKSKNLKYIINLDENDIRPPIISYKALFMRKKKLKFVEPKLSENDTALILFSSGSTGLPKGVMLSNRSLVFFLTLIRFREQMKDGPKTVLLSVIPLFHGYGVSLLIRILVTRGQMVILKKFQSETFLSAVKKYKVTYLSLVPALMVFLAKHPIVENYDLSSINEVSCGAAPLSTEIEEEVRKKLNLEMIVKGYGMTETTIAATFSVAEHKLGSVGKLLPGMMAKVIDKETGEILGANKEGEICFKGILLMQGYYNNKKETDSTIDKDGWLHTGDVGYYDDEEDFFIVDRIKDLIKYKGFQVAPAELEALLLKHEAVKDAAVVGISDEIAGEIPRAFVVKMKDVTERELVDYVDGQVASHMKLRGGVKFIKEIPRNANGKILRRDLRTWSKSKL